MKKILSFSLFLLIVQSSYGQIPVAEAWYPFCNNANDFSGKARNGTVTACYSAQSRFGQNNGAYNFPGSGYIRVPTSTILGLDTYCYSLWIYLLSTSSTAQCIFSGGGNDIYDQNLVVASGFLIAVSHNSGGTPATSSVSSPTLSLNQWHHVVVLRNSTLMRMYVDNVAYTGTYHNGTYSRWGSTSPYNILLGVRSNGLDNFNGLMDDVRLYAGNLSPTQITALYQEAIYPKVTAYGDTICAGETATLSAIGANSYTLPGTPSGFVTPQTTTTYSVLGSINTCVSTATAMVIVNECTSIKEEKSLSTINVFPNPSKADFQLTINNDANNLTTYSIEDLSGRSIIKSEIIEQKSIKMRSDIAPGTYILRLYNGEKCMAIKKIIVE